MRMKSCMVVRACNARTSPLTARRSQIFALLISLFAFAAVVPAVAQATKVTWSKHVRIIPISRGGGLSGVSCPALALCVAVDQGGYADVSTRPLSDIWRKSISIDAGGGGINAISCPTVHLCVAVDNDGRVITTTDPLGTAKAWAHPVHVDASNGSDGGQVALTGIDCPSTTLCVVTDSADPASILTSSDPTGGASAWALTKLSGTLDTVSCVPATTFCMVAGSHQEWSNFPAGGTSAWHSAGSQGDVMAALDCPATGECVGVGYGSQAPAIVSSTTTPRGAASAWRSVAIGYNPPIGGQGLLDAVSCTQTKFCVAVSSIDAAWSSNAPTSGNWPGGAAIRPLHGGPLSSAISCRHGLCMVVDSAGFATVGIPK
jgi:hypothetical protein